MNIEKKSLVNELISVHGALLEQNIPEPYTILMTRDSFQRLLNELEFLVVEPSSKKPMVLGMLIEVME